MTDRDASGERTVRLSDIADIVVPRVVTMPGYVLRPADFRYPFPDDLASKEKTSDVALEQGDIVVALSPHIRTFLLTTKPDHDVRASWKTVVVRPQDGMVSPFYLTLYLNSETALQYATAHQQGTVLPRLTIRALRDFPIVLPSAETQSQSQQVFERLFLASGPSRLDRINEFLFSPAPLPTKPIQRAFIEEVVASLRESKRQLLSNMLHADFSEINRCLEVSAYKSCLILSGSILEAVLLDWLSEIDAQDHFMSGARITLNNVILRLRDRLGDAYERADKIRDRRNLVHPKKLLRAATVVDEAACREVLTDLRTVLSRRGLTTD